MRVETSFHFINQYEANWHLTLVIGNKTKEIKTKPSVSYQLNFNFKVTNVQVE